MADLLWWAGDLQTAIPTVNPVHVLVLPWYFPGVALFGPGIALVIAVILLC